MEKAGSPALLGPSTPGFSWKRLLWRLLGDRVEDDLLAYMAMLFMAVASQYAVIAIFPIWAVSRLATSSATVGLGFAVGGALAALAAPLGGRVSDRIGRRRVIMAGLLATTAAPLLLVGPVPGPVIGLGVYVVCCVGVAVRWAAQQALVGDLVARSGREQGFAAVRVAYNAGAGVGPLLASVLVLLDFRAVFVAASALSVGALLFLRAVPDPRRAKAADLTSRPRAWTLLSSPAMMLAILASLFAWCVYQAFELLLPISLTKSHGYPPYAWGLLFAINPLLVTVFQVRVVRWTSAIPRYIKLSGACLLMGLPFLIVPADAAVPLIALLLVLFTLGEMSFGPVNQAMITDIAPPDLRGAAMGLLAATSSVSVALTPAFGLGVRSAWGDSAMWFVIAGLSVTAAALFFGLTRKITAATVDEAADS